MNTKKIKDNPNTKKPPDGGYTDDGALECDQPGDSLTTSS
jgi:hypothetical protein